MIIILAIDERCSKINHHLQDFDPSISKTTDLVFVFYNFWVFF